MSWKVWWGLVQLTLTCVDMFSHLFRGVGLKEWHYSIHVYVLKSLACVRIWILWQTTQFCRALALQALVECLSRNWWRFGLYDTYEPYRLLHISDKLHKPYKPSYWSMKQIAKTIENWHFFNKMIYCINQWISFTTKIHILNEFWQYQVIFPTPYLSYNG